MIIFHANITTGQFFITTFNDVKQEYYLKNNISSKHISYRVYDGNIFKIWNLAIFHGLWVEFFVYSFSNMNPNKLFQNETI